MVCGSSPNPKAAPVGSLGILAATQSVMAGVPEPEVAGSWKTPKALPPNSPVTIPRCEPGATAIPLVPADKPVNSGNDWICMGAVQVPAGVPGVNVAWVRSVIRMLPVNSIEASAMPVVQSSAEESNSPAPGMGLLKYFVLPFSVLYSP